MKSPAFAIFLEKDEMTVAAVGPDGAVRTEIVAPPAAEASGTVNPAPALRETLDHLGYKGGGVCLGVSSTETFVAPIDTGNLPRNPSERRQAMMFRLEEHLPIDAEQMVADFLPASAGGIVLGVAVQSKPLANLIAQLAEVGVEVESLSPTPLLALAEALRAGENTDAEYWVLATSSHVDVFRIAEGRPQTWHTTTADSDEVVRAVKAEMLAHPGPSPNPCAAVIGPLPAGHMASSCAAAGLACRTMEHASLVELAARSAARLLEGEEAGWVDLRRGALGHENPWGRLAVPLKAAVITAIVVLAAVSAAAHFRAWRYDTIADHALAEETSLHQKVFPNTRTPIDVQSRLASEARRLEGLRGTTGAMPLKPFSALDTFNQVAGSVPETLRIRLVDIRVDAGGLLIEGQARSHADAEKLAQAIRAGGRFASDSPRSEQLIKGGVSFTLGAKPAPSVTAAAKGARP
jgi:type II secretion system protein L